MDDQVVMMTQRTWVYQPQIRTFFWARTAQDRLSDRQLALDDEFAEWCWQQGCTTQQTWVTVPDDRTAALFLLKWC